MIPSIPMIAQSLKYALLVGCVGFTLGCRSVDSPSFISSIASDTTASSKSQPTPQSESVEEPPSRWPARWGNDPARPGIIIKLDPAEKLHPLHYSRYYQARSTPIEYDDANTLAAQVGITTGFKFVAEGPGAFVFTPRFNPLKEEPKVDLKAPDLAFKFVSATLAKNEDIQPALPKEDDPLAAYEIRIVQDDPDAPEPVDFVPDQDHVILQRTWFTYRDPKEIKGSDKSSDSPAANAKGTIVLLPGMFGTPELIVSAFERYWVAQGYAVILMRSQPSRFSEHHMFNIAPGIAGMIAGDVARMNDERVAEGAYSTRAAVEYVYSQRPSLKDKPTILIGMSGGAMMLPTVYAYAPELYDASVIIAGGADFLRIAIESNYKSWIDAISFDFDPDPATQGTISDQSLDIFSDDYLRKSKLDAYHTATEMTDTPVLMLHASNDKAVPAYTGQLLYQQLGKPERWSYPVGHELIFIGLPTQITRIDKWITSQIEDLKD